MFVQLDSRTARSWQAAQVPWWVPRIVLVGAAVAAFAVAVATADTPCSTTDPTVCGPDTRFTIAFALLLATPILLWWLPALGCVTGAGFAAADVTFDPVVEGKAVWGVFGALCVLVGLWLLWSGRRQGTVIEWLGPSRGRPDPAGLRDEVLPGHRWLGWAPVAALLVAGAAAFAVYNNNVTAEQVHLDVAVRLDARVLAYDGENYLVTVDTGTSGQRVIDSLDEYRVGAVVPVLVDPTDRSWARLVAEPADFTFPETLGFDCLLFAGCLAWWRISVRRTERRLLGEDAPALRVLVGASVKAPLSVFAVDDRDGEHPVATFTVSGSPIDIGGLGRRFLSLSVDGTGDREPAEFDPRWQRENGDRDSDDWADYAEGDEDEADETGAAPFRIFEPTPATVFGLFRDRGRVVLVVDHTGALRGRVRAVDAVSRRFEFDPAADLAVEEPASTDPAGHLVTDAPSRMDARTTDTDTDTDLTAGLPRTVRHSLVDRLVFGTCAVAGLAGVPAIELLIDSARWYNRVVVAFLGLGFVAYCAARATARLVLDRQALTVTGMFLDRAFPWHRVDSVRVDRNRISIAYEPASTVTRGPYTARNGSGPTAESVAAAIMSLRVGPAPPARVTRRSAPARRSHGWPSSCSTRSALPPRCGWSRGVADV